MEEANAAIASGASALGLVGAMPSGPGVVPNDIAFTIARHCPPGVETFMLTSHVTKEDILAHYDQVRPSVIQLTDNVEPAVLIALRSSLPTTKLVQVVHIENEDSIAWGLSLQGMVDGFLLDSGNTTLVVKELGGTGRVHDWQLSTRFVRESKKPVFLAGGINHENVEEAYRVVKPYGFDLCSGVRQRDVLDTSRLAAFSQAIHALNARL